MRTLQTGLLLIVAMQMVNAADNQPGDTNANEKASPATEKPIGVDNVMDTEHWRTVVGDSYEGVVTKGNRRYWAVVAAGITGEYEISDADIAALEQILPDAIREAGHAQIADELKAYMRWYYGALVAGEQRILVQLSRLDDDIKERLNQAPLGVQDEFQLSVTYNPEAAQFDLILIGR